MIPVKKDGFDNPIVPQFLAALAVSLCSTVVGFSTSYTSALSSSLILPKPNSTIGEAMKLLVNEATVTGLVKSIEVSGVGVSWIGSIEYLASFFGAICGGPLVEFFGRRNTIFYAGFPFLMSWLFIGFASDMSMILIGRAISGFVVGITALAFPLFLAEALQPHVRGMLGLLPTALGNTGVCLGYIGGKWLNWRNLAFLGDLLLIPYMLLISIVPETPHWYISHGREEEARTALQWMRGKQADVELEFQGIVNAHNESEQNTSINSYKELLTRDNIRPLSILVGLMIFQQFSGINSVISFAQMIFIYAGAENSSDSPIVLGVVNFIATFGAIALIDRVGRKILLYVSSVGMMVTSTILGGYFLGKESDNVSSINWIPLVCLVLYIMSFSVGFGPVPWLMMGEILPVEVRGAGGSFVTCANFGSAFIVTKTFSYFIEKFGIHVPFWIYAVCCAIAIVFIKFKVPETRGKSLEEIERMMTEHIRPRRTHSQLG